MGNSASLFDEMGCGHDDLRILSSLGENAVGHVPEDIEAAERRMSNQVDTQDPAIATLFQDIDPTMGNGEKSPDDAEGKEADILPESDASYFGEATEDVLKEEVKEQPKKRKAKAPTVWLWLPVRFRDVPHKGSWDITRIRDSEYFFS